jgi:dihydrofolate reductase
VARLVYAAIASLDGYIADADGTFDWSAPDEEVHAFVNELERPIGTYLYGRRIYEVMAVWDDPRTVAGEPAVMKDYAQIWQAADKVVYSRTLTSVGTARTRLERDFDPDAIRQLKANADRDISIGGSELAGQAIAAGLVDEWHLFVTPIIVGGGKPSLPDGVHIRLELVRERRFVGGTVYLHYRTAA